jgi:transposase-like protein
MDMESRLRVGRVIAKTEEEAAYLVMGQIKKHNPEEPPAMATDGLGAYREAMLKELGKCSRISWSWKTANTPYPWRRLEISTSR